MSLRRAVLLGVITALVILLHLSKTDAAVFTMLNGEAYFDGSNQTEFSSASLATFGGADHTVVAWFKTYASSGSIVAKTASGSSWQTRGKCFYIRDGNLQVDSHGIGYIQGSKVVNDGKWHMAAWQFTASSNSYRISLDGKHDTSSSLALATDSNNHVLRLGNCADNFIGKLTGHLRSVVVYDYRLSNNGIHYLYRNSFNQRELIWNSQTEFNNGVYYSVSTAQWKTVGTWWKLFNNFGKVDFSLSVWVKTSNDGILMMRSDSSGSWVYRGKQFYINSGKIKFDAHSVGNIAGTSTVTDDQWHYLVFTQDIETETWKIYVDGVLENEKTVTVLEDTGDSHTISFPKTFIGTLEGLFYYTYTLTAEEISSRYNGYPDDTFCPKDWYPFQGSCYYFQNSNDIGYNGFQAKDYCYSIDAKLASIDNQWEQDFLYYIAKTYYPLSGSEWWIGLEQEESSVNKYNFRADGSRIMWDFWSLTEPDSTARHCVRCEVHKSMQWNDRECDNVEDLWNVICERPEECHFVHVEGQYINLNAFDKTVTSTTVADCKHACLHEKTFTCRSFNFRVSDSACDLMTHNRYTITSNQWVEDANTDYYERQCTTDQENACEPGWFEWRGQCYRFSEETLNFQDAVTKCQTNGGHLASINSAEEMDFIKEKASIFYEGHSFYIGMQWGGHGHSWIDGSSVFYSNFAHGEGRLVSITCENNMAELDCGQGQVIRVSYANFGRTSLTHCNSTIQRSDCFDPYSLNTVVDTCNGLQRCSINASANTFSVTDTCSGATRYLEIHYNCVPTSTFSPFITSPTGCMCYFDTNSYDCACCTAGNCQCGSTAPHKCGPCGQANCASQLPDHGNKTCVIMSPNDDYNWHDHSCQRTDQHYLCKQAREVIAPLRCVTHTESGSNTATCPADAPNAISCRCSCANWVIKNYGSVCDCSLCGTQTEAVAQCCATTPPGGYDPGPDYQAFFQCTNLRGDPYTGATCPADEYPTAVACACGNCNNGWWISGNNTCTCDTLVTSDWVEAQCCRILLKPRSGGFLEDQYIRWDGASTNGYNHWDMGSTTTASGCMQHCEGQVGCRSFDWNPSNGHCYLSKDTHRTLGTPGITTQGTTHLYERYTATMEDHPSLVNNYFRRIEGYSLSGHNFGDSKAVSRDTCLLLCLRHPECKSVDYDYVASSGCWLNTETRLSQPSSFSSYYNYDYYEFIDNGDPQIECHHVTETGHYAHCGMIGTWMDHFNIIEYAALSGYNNAYHYGTTINNCLKLCHNDGSCKTIDQRDIDTGYSDYVCDLSYDTRFTISDSNSFMKGSWPFYNNFVFDGFRGDYLRDSFSHILGHYVMWSTITSSTKTLAECMDLCYADTQCKAIDYSPGSSNCVLKNQNRFSQPMKYFVADSSWDHYEFIGFRANIASCACSNGCNSLTFQNQIVGDFGNRCYCHGNQRATAQCCKARHRRRPPCPPGTYSPTGYHGNVRCTQCAAGTYSSDTGSTQCKKCPPGYISSDIGQTSCTKCPHGGVTNDLGDKCLPCKTGYMNNVLTQKYCMRQDCTTDPVTECKGSACKEGRSSMGLEFRMPFPEGSGNDMILKLVFSAVALTNVTVTAPGCCDMSMTVQASSSAMANVMLASLGLQVIGSNKANNAISIVATEKISVHAQLSDNNNSTGEDWFQVMPISSLGYEYFAVCWTPESSSGDLTQLDVVATRNGTYVVVTLGAGVTYDGQEYAKGQQIHLTMADNEVLQLQSEGDLTGTRVVADKPIAVYSGNIHLTSIGSSNFENITAENKTAWTLVEQMIPVEAWGTVFAMPKMNNVQVKVLASLDHTELTFANGTMTKIKKRGQSVVIPASVDNSGFYITASKPVLVVAYVEAENVSSLGMIVLPPVQQGGSNFFFTSESPTMITVAVDACHLDNVLVNNFPPVGGAVVQPYPSVQMTDITTLSFKLPAGVHSLSLSNGKAFVVIGQSLDSAAIFSLGAYSNFINKVSRRRFYQPKAIGKGFALSDPSKVHKSLTVRHMLACLDSCMQDAICHSVVFAVTGTQSGTCELTAYHTADLLVDDYISTGEHEIYSIKL